MKTRLFTFLTLAVATLLWGTGCITTEKSTDSNRFDKRFTGFEYCSVDAVKQSRQKSCGAAALTCVLNYWKAEGTPEIREKELITKYPSQSEEGYPLLQMREIALKEKFPAFALSMSEDPLRKITSHVSAGRPVIVALRLPRGRYFGKKIPVIETLDRRTVFASKIEWKSHYVVVIGHSYKEILVMDPQFGIVRLPRDQFLHFWKQEKYAALLISAIG